MTAPANDPEQFRPKTFTVSSQPMSRDDARELIERLENSDIPANSILLEDYATRRNRSRREGPLFGDVGRRVVIGIIGGALAGALLGAIASTVADLRLGLAIAVGSVFGAFAGVAVGGIGVVRFASPAWRDAGDSAPPTLVLVTVEHPDRSVVDIAIEVIGSHQTSAGDTD